MAQDEQNNKTATDKQETNLNAWHHLSDGHLVKDDAPDENRATFPPLSVKRAQKIKKTHQLSKDYLFRAAILLIVIISGLAGFFGGWLGASHYDSTHSLTPIATGSGEVIVSNNGDTINKIASSVGQSVVSIDVTSNTASSGTTDIFGLSGLSPVDTQQQDAGTGIILSANGLIITNRHVIPQGTTSVSVTLSDGTQYNNVKVVGETAQNDSLDIAFLQIQNLNGRTLVPATLGNSSNMKIGYPVVAIGNALGQFQNTVTSGIISGYGRSVQASASSGSTAENLVDLFQTDAAINEGNSGGPLVNLNGDVIGINTAIASNAQNIGFAIPINDVTGLIKSVEQTGKLAQPYLGVIYIPITNDVAQQYNLSATNGAWIPPSGVIGENPILSGSPAASANLQVGDIITKIDGTVLNENNSLTSILDQDSVGQSVTLTVIRNGKTISVPITLGTAPTS
jgi:serine protease Do